MEKLYDIFFKIQFIDWNTFFIKMAAIPLLSLIVLYLTFLVWMALSKKEEPYPIFVNEMFLRSIITVLIVLFVYSGLLFYTNGLFAFTWYSFPSDKSNIYFLLSPLISTYLIIYLMYYLTNKRLTTLIK